MLHVINYSNYFLSTIFSSFKIFYSIIVSEKPLMGGDNLKICIV